MMDTHEFDLDGGAKVRSVSLQLTERRSFDRLPRAFPVQTANPVQTAKAAPHRPRSLPVEGLRTFCGPDCPACAQERARKAMMIDGVREIVLGMWLEAIKKGDRSLESALQGLSGPLAKLSFRERSRIGWAFVEAAMAVPADKEGGKRPPRGLPSTWRRANMQIVDMVNEIEGLALTPVANEQDMRTAFHRVAGIWNDWGIPATALPVEDAYWRQKHITEVR